jgi:putative heme-binding domain-containing protein
MAGVASAQLKALTDVAMTEPSPVIRLQLASTAQQLGKKDDTLYLLHALMHHKEDATDPVIPLLLWLAYEPQLAAKPQAELDWLRANAPGNPLVTDHILPRAVRRLIATGKPDDLAACVALIGATKDAVRLRALEGLAEALKGRSVDVPANWSGVQADLLAGADERVKRLARNLGANFRDPAAVRRALAVVLDRGLPIADRLDAVRALALTRPPEARSPLVTLVREAVELELRAEACRALAGFDAPDLAGPLLAGWAAYPPVLRGEVVQALAARREWARDLLAAVAAGKVEKTALSSNTVLRLRAFKDRRLNADIEKVWGKVRDTPAELTALIDTMRGELAKAPGSFVRGRAVFDNQCAKCHQFEGRGHSVGPALDGAGRDIEYLLVNVLDPNRVVGQPYFLRRVALKSGRIEEGLLAAEDPQTITLKGENDALRTIPKKDVEEVEVVERSMMPEGLANTMTVQDFRDLVRYVMAHPFVTEVSITAPTSQQLEAPFNLPMSSKDPQPLPRGSFGVSGRIPLPDAKQDGYAYIGAQVTAPRVLKTRLLLGAAHPLRAWLNGKLVYEGRPGDRDAQPDQASADVELAPGTNQIVVEVRYRGERQAVYARFLDPDRKLTHPEPAAKK